MVKALVLRGMGAGAIAGLLAFVFARIFAEPLLQRAIDYGAGRDDASNDLAVAAGQAPAGAGPDIFSRTVQSGIGISVGMVFVGVAFGALFALAFALYHGRVGKLRPRTLALLLAGGGFAAIYLVPFLKYPTNPPSIGHEETLSDRAGLYLLMVVASVVFAVFAVWAGQRLSQRFSHWKATLLAGAGFVVVMAIVTAILPSLGELGANVATFGPHATETPQPLTNPAGQIVYPGFDADLLYSFRIYSVAAQAILWAGLGLIFGPLAQRVADADTPTDPAARQQTRGSAPTDSSFTSS